jgi:hypothetical protein
MEQEPDMPAVESVDLSPIAPRHDDAVYARVAARAIELRKLRRVVVRRAAVAAVLAAAAAIVFWLSAPRRDVSQPIPTQRGGGHILELGMRGDVDPYELLDLGGTHAQ